MLIGRALSLTAERFSDRPAIVSGGLRLSYRQWDAQTNRLARALGELGVRRGGRVAIIAAGGEPLASTHLAANKLGACSVPLNVRFSADELAHCLRDCDPAALITDDSTSALARAALERLDGERPFAMVHAGEDPPVADHHGYQQLLERCSDAPVDVCVDAQDESVMLYTAGTTGRPKGVPRSQHAEVCAGLAHVVQARYGFGESCLGAMPMYHTMGLRLLVSSILIGGKLVLLGSFTASAALDAIERERLSALYLVPTAYGSLVQEAEAGRACATVTKLAYAGAPMTQTLAGRLSELIRPQVFINHYGSTEIYTFSVESDAAARPQSAGRPGLFARLRVVRADASRHVGPQELVEAGETGEVICSLESDEAFGGYWRRPEADRRALREGWYFTGDLGHLDEEGNLVLSGRVDDMVISGGENVHPVEVEDVLARCPAVGEVAVAGLPDEHWGQAVTAFVIPSPEAPQDPLEAARTIAGWVRADSGLASYKRPKSIVILEALPKSPVGKILRRELVAGRYRQLGEARP